MKRDLLGRVFETKSPSDGWRMLCYWFMPKTIAGQVKWSVAFDSARMEKGEEPMKYFGRIDKIVGVLALLGLAKTVADVNRMIIMTLKSDYEMEERTILYREDVTRAKIESIIRQRHLRLPASKGKNVGQALFPNGAARGGRAGRSRHRSNGEPRSGSDTASKNSQSSSSSIPPAPIQDPLSAFDKVKGKCILCLEPGHTWSQCKARIPPAPEQTSGGPAQGQNNCGETLCCLAKCMVGTNDDP